MTPTCNPFDFPLVWPTFATRWVLLALVVPLLLLVWVWAHRWLLPARRVVLPFDHARGGSGWWCVVAHRPRRVAPAAAPRRRRS